MKAHSDTKLKKPKSASGILMIRQNSFHDIPSLLCLDYIYMGQIPQDGKNEQYVALFFNFWRFTVTKRLDFFKFSQLFWRDYVR